MDLVQLLLLCSLLVTCNAREISSLVDLTSYSEQRLRRLQKLERRLESYRRNKLYARKFESKTTSYGAIVHGMRVEEDNDCVDGMACPLSEDTVCVQFKDLCDGVFNCPNKEDENPVACMFFKMTQHNAIKTEPLITFNRRSLGRLRH